MKLMKLVAIVFCLLVTSDLSRAQVPQDYQAARNSVQGLGALLGGGNNAGGGLGALLGGGNNSGGGLGALLGGGNNSGGGLGALLGGGNNSGGGLGALLGGGNNTAGGLQNLQGMIPGLSGGQQNPNTGTDFLSRINQSSKSVVDRTTNWARQKKQAMSQKMLGNALGNLVPGLNQQQSTQKKSAFDWLKPKTFQSPTQPPLRSAQNYGQQPGIRY